MVCIGFHLMCRIIAPTFRRNWWGVLNAAQIKWQYRKNVFASSAYCLRLNEMSSAVQEHTSSPVFQGKKDMYRGIVLNSKETFGCECFSSTLEESLKYWSQNDIRTVWFNISLEHAALVPVLAKNGFKFHHTKEDEVVMYKWLPQNEDCNIPFYCHTMIGVGAVVINSFGELLVIQERFSRKRQWKLPGGYLEPGENIGDAAVREVLEETSVQTEFKYLASFRHMHKANFGSSDIYFVARLKPLSDEIEKCDKEIQACIWMKVDEFLEHPEVHEGNKFFVKKCLDYEQKGSSIGCIQNMHPAINRPQCVYSIMANKDIQAYQLKFEK